MLTRRRLGNGRFFYIACILLAEDLLARVCGVRREEGGFFERGRRRGGFLALGARQSSSGASGVSFFTARIRVLRIEAISEYLENAANARIQRQNAAVRAATRLFGGDRRETVRELHLVGHRGGSPQISAVAAVVVVVVIAVKKDFDMLFGRSTRVQSSYCLAEFVGVDG